jgi:predicted nucleic acid-binding protein
MPRLAFDSNFMAYAEGVDDRQRQELAARLVLALKFEEILVPLQAVGELLSVLVRKLRLNPSEAVLRAAVWLRYPTQETNRSVIDGAMELVSRHSLQIWDSIILSAAEVGGASILLSEDMQDGFSWGQVTVINPFALRPSQLVGELLDRKFQRGGNI